MSKKKEKKSILSKTKSFFKFFIIIALIVGLIGFGASVMLIRNALRDVKPIDPSQINEKLVENSVIYDSNGVELEKLHEGGLRTVIKYEDMSENLINAYVATEDKTFFEHFGFNIVRMIGAVRDAVIKGEKISGTSTITQQLARNLYLFEIRSKRTLDRKIKEAYYALQLEKYLTKEQIIESYLNTIYLGSNTKGVQAASRKYFSKDAKELTLEESALLAGVPKMPSRYSPMLTINNDEIEDESMVVMKIDETYSYVYNPECEDRYHLVLKLMYENGKISEQEYQQANATDIKSLLNPSISKSTEISSYFVDMVKDEVIEDLMAKYDYTKDEATEYIQTGGLHIYSTIDFDMQKTLENAYANDNFTEYFGPSTIEAVKVFQEKYNLTIDGVVGSGTISKFEELGYAKKSDFELTIYKYGVEHKDVKEIKRILYEENLFSNNDLFPKVKVHFDENENILNDEGNRILLYKYSNLVNENEQLMLPESDYYYDEEGNLVLLNNKKLNFYGHYDKDKLQRIQVVIKNTFRYNEESNENSYSSKSGMHSIVDMYTYQGRDILIPDEYKSFDDEKNVVISKEFLDSEENIFINDENKLLINDDNYVIEDKGVIQPQSSMVIIDYKTGQLKAIVGGRNISGQKIYNRAINPRQPGSAIKPLAVYTPALDSRQYTAASVIDDVPTYLGDNPNERWPLNWYESSDRYNYKYRGIFTLREGIEYSLNVVTAKLANRLGIDTCLNSLRNFGISTIVDSGRVNDHNLAAVSLGGMSKGIKPIEMAEAYGTFGNNGVKVETHTYTRVEDSFGEVLLDKTPHKEVVLDEEVAFLMRDIMQSAVTDGIANKAKIKDGNKGIPVAGKTGTTSNNFDAWFSGYTPYYVGVTWFGNDYNLELDEGSSISAQFWSYVMKNIHSELSDRAFSGPPDGIVRIKVDTKSGKLPSKLSYQDPRGTVEEEYFIRGTQPTELDDVHVKVPIDSQSGQLATKNCPDEFIVEKVFTKRLDGPYNPNNHLYYPKDSKEGKPIHIRDEQYSVPYNYCKLHPTYDGELPPGEDVTENGENGEEEIVRHITFFADESAIVVKSFKMYLNDGSMVELPVRTRISVDKTVTLPDGTVYTPDKILDIPYYDYERQIFLNSRNRSN